MIVFEIEIAAAETGGWWQLEIRRAADHSRVYAAQAERFDDVRAALLAALESGVLRFPRA